MKLTQRELMEQEKERVIALYKEGRTLKEIAEMYNIQPEYLSHALEDWGVRERIRMWTADEDALIRKMSAKGKGYIEIGKALGRTRGAVARRALKIGLVHRAHAVNDPLPIEKIHKDADYYILYKGEEEVAEGTARDIAHQLGITVQTVYGYNTPSYKRRIKPENRRALVKLGKAHEFYYEEW